MPQQETPQAPTKEGEGQGAQRRDEKQDWGRKIGEEWVRKEQGNARNKWGRMGRKGGGVGPWIEIKGSHIRKGSSQGAKAKGEMESHMPSQGNLVHKAGIAGLPAVVGRNMHDLNRDKRRG